MERGSGRGVGAAGGDLWQGRGGREGKRGRDAGPSASAGSDGRASGEGNVIYDWNAAGIGCK